MEISQRRRSLWIHIGGRTGGRGRKIVKSFDEVGGSKDCLSISKTEFGPLMEAMGTDYCEEANRRTITKIELDG